MIQYLKQDEKIKSRALYEEVFPDDQESFVDFYYADRAKKNKILASVEDGEVVAMLHRNPYQVVVKDQVWKIDYIACVGTTPRRRHQGYMSRLLSRCFADMHMERMGFSFLVPAHPSIYRPFDFTYICDLPQRALNERGQSHLNSRACIESSGECKDVARFAVQQLEKQYEVYTLRDEEYYRSLCREVRSGDGDLVLLRTRDDSEELVGISAYYGAQGQEVREFITLPEYQKDTGSPKPSVMGRIIHLEQFLSVIRLKEDSEVSQMELLIEVKDGFIRQNEGIFRWKLDRNGSEVSRVSREETFQPELSIGIADLTSWLFGYSMPQVPYSKQEIIDKIQPLQGVYFDEIV